MSESHSRSDWRTPAQALARWTVLLMGWVWLGQQGQRLTWSLASGVGAVVVWWGVRLFLAQRPSVAGTVSRGTLALLGSGTAVGAVLLSQAQAGLGAQWGLLALAVVWAVWASALEQQAQSARPCRRPWAGWPPILAAIATGSVIAAPGPTVGAVLLACTVLAAWGQNAPVAHRGAPAQGFTAPSLPATAMGWMMGSLWLSNAWCAQTAWSQQTMVGLHLVLMAVLPAVIRLSWFPAAMPWAAQRAVPLALVATGGGLLGVGSTLTHGAVGMFLMALAWALSGRAVQPTVATPSNRAWAIPLLVGPMVLLAIGQQSPSLGPQALTWAYGALSAWAAALLTREAWCHWALLRPPMAQRH